MEYPNIPSALRPVLHGEGISIPEPPKEFTIDSDDEDERKSPEKNHSLQKMMLNFQPDIQHNLNRTFLYTNLKTTMRS